MSIKFNVVPLLIIAITILLIFESITSGQEISFSSDNHPATKSDIKSKSVENFTEIDMHALNAPEAAEKSIESLAAYLTEPAKNDKEKARAIYRWIAENIDYDVNGFFKNTFGDTSAEGVLKSGRSVCGGYSNLFERLANASGLETVTISGYSKGYGYTPGMRFSGPTNHAWNAVKINGNWYLVDSTWGAGNVDTNGKFNREFEDYYFLTPPSEFVYRHFPEDPKWQLLDSPISKEEFEDLVYLLPEFFDLGMRLGNGKNITIISDGQANISLYAPKDVFLSAELEMRSRNGIPRVAYGSPTLVKRSGEQYIIELLPPFPGEYSLRIYGKRDNSKGLSKQVMEYNIEELSGSNRSFPFVFDEFFDLGFRLDNKTNGMIVAKGDANLTLNVPTNVLMIASLEKLGEGKISPTDYSKSVFVQRSGDQYEITLSPPTAGEYILDIFAKRKDDSSNSYPMVMQFNVSALSGSNRSYPIVFDKFFNLGFKLDNKTNGMIVAKGDANLTLNVPANVLVTASLEKLGQEDSSKDYSKSIFVQRSGDQSEISLSPPTAGEYLLNIFAKRKDDSSNSYPMVMQFNVSALSGSNRSFPETFGGFQEMGVYLFSPLTGEVKAGSNQTFKIKIPGAKEVAVISGDRWNYLTKNGDVFQGNAIIKKGDVDVAAKLSGESDYSTIMRYAGI